MTPNKKILMWCISMYHVTGLKKTCSIKNILKAKKNCGCGGLLGRVVACELKRLPRFLPKEYMAEQSNSCIVRQKY